METTINPFLSEAYTADHDLTKLYHEQVSYLFSKIYKIPANIIQKYVEQVFQINRNGFKPINVKVLEKNKYGDREVKIQPITDFFETVEAKNLHLSPSFVGYTNYDECPAVNAIGTKKWIGDRKKYKGLRKKAAISSDWYAYKTYDEIQNALKIFNNAQSGAMSSNGTPIRNKSGHTTLTSICRTVTSTVNLMNERLLNGNRLFINYKKTMQHMVSVLKSTDFVKLNAVMERLKMNHATVEHVMAMVKNCMKYYGGNSDTYEKIQAFIELLRPDERTAVLCIGDIKGLFTTNRDVIKAYLDDWIAVPEIPKDAKAEDYPEPSNGDYSTLIITKIGQKASKLETNHLNQYHLDVEKKWYDFIEVFFKTRTAISDVFSVTEMIREAVLTSDTDSSIYSADDVTELYGADEQQMIRLNGVLTYFIRMMAIHQHAQLSKNMNVSDVNQANLNMKNEFLFGSYVTTLMSKHYYATQLMQEGVMRDEVKMEIKGVHLRSSKVALMIKEFAHKLMREILDVIYYKRKLNASVILHNVAELERLIIDEVSQGEWKWLSKATIKAREGYADADKAVYQYHELWEEVFADKYGAAPPIPYVGIKVNVDLTSRGKIDSYFEMLGECELKERLDRYLKIRSKDKITTFYVPADNLLSIKTIPTEIVKAADIRRIVKQNLKSVYAVLESAGLHFINKNISRLVSDEH